MNTSKRGDQIFQLSLTEIAFTIAFILLLLLGHLVSRETKARMKAEEKLAKVQELGAAQKAFDETSRRLKEELIKAGSTTPDEAISRLVDKTEAATQRDRLLVQIKDLKAQISSLAEVKQMAADAAKEGGKKAVLERVLTALTMQSDAEEAISKAKESGSTHASKPTPAAGSNSSAVAKEKASNIQRGFTTSSSTPEETRAEVRRSIQTMAAVDQALRDTGATPLVAGEEAATVASMVRVAQSLRGNDGKGKGVESILKENADLRGQMANMRNKSSASGRGLDHPPCWADEAGNIEYLFRVELKQGSFVLLPEWPKRRQIDAERLPGVAELTATPANTERFRAASQQILDISKRQDPECRHFVVINNTIETRREADQARWIVENYFYKREASK
jgi:hypothetical protein